MNNFTPGPWKFCGLSSIYSVGGKPIAYINGEPVTNTFDHEPMANAKLIAAAPMMFEALEDAWQFITNGIEFGYIRMPDKDTPDSAHNTLTKLEVAIGAAKGGKG